LAGYVLDPRQKIDFLYTRNETHRSSRDICNATWSAGVRGQLSSSSQSRKDKEITPFLTQLPSKNLKKSVLLIHVGKTCGTTVEMFLKYRGIKFKEMHQKSVPPSLIPLFDIVIIPVRDPLERTISAYHYCYDRWVSEGKPSTENNLFYNLFSTFDEYVGNLSDHSFRGAISRIATGHISSNYCYYIGGVLEELQRHKFVYLVNTNSCLQDMIELFHKMGWESKDPKADSHVKQATAPSVKQMSLPIRMTATGFLEMIGEYDVYNFLMKTFNNTLRKKV
jgi:hypothetical protein